MNTPAATAATSITPQTTYHRLSDSSDSLKVRSVLGLETQPSSPALDWLTAALAREEERRRLFRNPNDEQQMLMMRRPIGTQEAFARFGMLLGAIPPAAIFWRIFGDGLLSSSSDSSLFLLLILVMIFVCCVVGRAMGSKMGRQIDDLERDSWSLMLLVSAGLGLWWAVVTGATGGAIFFGLGAIFGVLCAVPVGMLGFLMFTSLHRLLARGGMIDARHFWPLALGVIGVITAFILQLRFSM